MKEEVERLFEKMESLKEQNEHIRIIRHTRRIWKIHEDA